MPRDVSRGDFYRPDLLNLWVEDPLTRSYLSTLWGDPKIKFLVGGGNDGVEALVRAAENEGYPNVFGVVDRDFRASNQADWSEPGKVIRRFVLPVHEIENYLLNPDALAACRFQNLKLSRDDIERFMVGRASRLCWWAACREVVADFRRRFRGDFLHDPNPEMQDELQARRHICESGWFKKLAKEAAASTEPEVHRSVKEAHIRATARLADGSWREEFAGKEILRYVGSRICDRTRIHGVVPKGAAFDAELAKQIAAWQKDEKSIPPKLSDLLAALKRQVANPP